MKYIFRSLCLILLFPLNNTAQTVAVLRVNGVTKSLNDTIKICVGTTLNYSSASLNVSATNWILNGGTPNVFAGPNPGNVAYNTAGIHQAFLLVTNGPDRDSTFIYVDVSNIKPIVGFAFTPNNQCGGTPITFTSNTTGPAPLTYSWAWGDGTAGSTNQNDIHTYAAMGPPYPGTRNYNVKHYATTSYGCVDSSTQVVNYKTTPHDSIVRGNSSISFTLFNGFPTFSFCVNQNFYGFQFLNKSLTAASNTSYTIKWGDGSPDSTFVSWPVVPATIITHTFPAGNSVMTVLTTGTDGCVTERKYNVFLGSNPSVGLSSPGSTSACAPVSFTFGINSFSNNPPGTIYEISVNDGSPLVTLSHPPPLSYTHNFNVSSCGNTSFFGGMPFPNSFTASIVAKNPCGQTPSGVASIYISKKPKSNIILSPGPVICANVPLTIINGTTAGAFINPGNAASCITNSLGVWEVTPSTGFTINSGSLGTTNNSSNTALWTPGSASLSISFANPTNYTIKLVSANDCGIDTADRVVCVRSAPTASFTMSADSSCGSSIIDFLNTSPITGACVGNLSSWAVAYQDLLGCGSPSNAFAFSGGTSATSISPKIQFNNPGRYIISLTMRANSVLAICPTAIFRDTFWVKGKPKIALSSIPAVCVNNTIAPIASVTNCYANQTPSYAWTFNNGLPTTSNLTSPTSILFSTVGLQTVGLAVSNECGTTNASTSVNITSAPLANAGLDKETCSGITTSIGGNAVAGVTYLWTPSTGLGNQNLAGTTVNLIYNGSNLDTTYEYILTASAGANCFKKDTVLVKIKKGVQLTVNPVSASICAGDRVKLTASGAVNYNWNPNAFLSIVSADTIFAKPVNTTIFNVTGSLPNGCNDTKNITVTVKPLPNTNAGNDVTVCNTTSNYQMLGTPSGGIWSGNVNINATGIFNAVAAGIGNYTVYYSATLNGCFKTDSAIINVVSAVAINAGIDTTVCQNTSSIQLVGSPVGGTWSGTPSVNAAGIFTPNTAGNINVTYSLGSGSCLVTDVKQVIVQPIISNNIITSNQQICINTAPALLTGNIPNGANGLFTYQWQESTNNVLFANINLAVNQNYQPPILNTVRYYRRIATTSLCNPQTSSSVFIDIKPLPIVNAGVDVTVCNTTTNYQMIGSPSGGVWSGNPNINSAGIFNAVNAGVGSFTLYYTVAINGCVNLDSTIITVISAAAINAGIDTTVCQNSSSFQLIGSPTGGTWSGTPSVNAAGIFTPNTAGNINVTYTLGSGSCLVTDAKQVIVQPIISNNVINSNQQICINNAPVIITGNKPNGGDGLFTYQWQVSTNNITFINIPLATNQNYQPPILSATTYYKRVATTTLCNPNTSASVAITVKLNAKAMFTATRNIGCAPFVINNSIINTTVLPAQNSSYNWFVNGASIGTNTTGLFPGYTMTLPNDSITIKLLVLSPFGCLSDTMIMGFKTPLQPTPLFTKSNNGGCAPIAISFTNNTVNANSYQFFWNFGNGQSSTLINPLPIIYNVGPTYNDTTYTIKMGAYAGCDTVFATTTVAIKSKPKALFAPVQSTGCSPFRAAFKNNSLGMRIKYYWDYGDGIKDTTTIRDTAFHVYNTGVRDTFFVQLIAENECGRDTLIYNLIVDPNTIQLDFAYNATDRYGCLPHTVKFFNNSIGANNFKWDFGDGNFATTTLNVDTIVHTYTTAGNFVVKLRGQNDCSDTTGNETITVFAKPIVSFNAAPTNVCIGDTVYFTNTSEPLTSLLWNFGDGTTATNTNPKKVYTTAGNFIAKLYGSKVQPSSLICSDSANVPITVFNSRPGSFFISDTIGNCVPFTIALKNTSITGGSTLWNFGNGNTAIGDTVNYTYTTPGTYILTMTATALGGCKYIKTRTIIVNAPTGTLNYTGGSKCNTATIPFTALALNAAQYKWNFGDGIITTTTANNIIHTYNTPGLFVPTVTLISAAGCEVILKTNDTIKVDKTTINFSLANTYNCGFTNTQFFDSSTAFFGVDTWQWSFGNSLTSTLQNPSTIYNTTNTYTVQLITKSKLGCIDTLNKFINIQVNTKPGVAISGNNTTCINQPLQQLAVVNSIDSISSFYWVSSTGQTAVGLNPFFTFASAGNYTIKLIAQTVFGCKDSAVVAITVFPSFNLLKSADARICLGQSTTLAVSGSAAWNWSPIGGLSCTNCPNPIATPLVTTLYAITATNANGCIKKDSIKVEVVQPLNMSVSPTLDTLCLGESTALFATNATTYNWQPATALLPNANVANPIATPLTTTDYMVIGKDAFNCFTDTGFVRIVVGQPATVNTGVNQTVATGTPVPLTPIYTNGPFNNYSWLPNTHLSCNNCPAPIATIHNDIAYILKATSIYGCVATDTIAFTVFCKSGQVYLPNGFKPDGSNKYMVRGQGISAVKLFKIFNRAGQVVFERSNFMPNDPNFGWDGKINGQLTAPDVFVYMCNVVCDNGVPFSYKGNITVIR